MIEQCTEVLDVWIGEAKSPDMAAEMADNDWCERWESYDMLDPELAYAPTTRGGYEIYRVVFITA